MRTLVQELPVDRHGETGAGQSSPQPRPIEK